MIRHSVVFTFKKEIEDRAKAEFFKAAWELKNIPGVKNFEVLKQFSSKNNYDYGILMELDDKKAYETYNNHPDHTKFVQQWWLNYIGEFMEIDFEGL